MKRVTSALLLACCLAACSTSPDAKPAPPEAQRTQTPPTTTQPEGPPPPPEPVADGPCPYLESAFVAQANGQRATKVRISADKPHPTCFFYRADGTVQLTARIYVGTAKNAKALVDEAAPINTSNPASSPTGWKGGSIGAEKGSTYAVAKEGAAVIVTTNQAQSIKARQVTEKVITALGL
ncbi:DUF2020 domain-containing protein [Kibdelosporangium phytohabitans]|uniref:DUF2020 domain-containing protein n=1 Tax=Kibdelosporangium phytohabitans TaxID=860235 RepID=A0A0N9HR87_9PSEU|nr:DUF2020 domain-containing protein [Kibdelosporangium phytohabitans]ALG05538.1 hypothetical protein AOZ06_00095 [Kibdelosporangium phytohabitans]MBE1466506.1 hypothetical protein [Kibdelosporangium phytohabitans]